MKVTVRRRNGTDALLTVLIIVSLLSIPMAAVGDLPNNDTFASAEEIDIPGDISGHLGITDVDDIYKSEAFKGQSLSVTVQPDDNLGVNLYLYIQEGEGSSATYKEVAKDRAPTIGVSEGQPRSVNYTCNSEQDSYWMFFWVGLEEGVGNYTLSITVKDQNDADTDTDAGDTYETATPLGAGDYHGFLAYADDEDIYGIDLLKGDSIYVDVQPEPGLSVNLQLVRLEYEDDLPVYNQVSIDKRTGDEGRGEARHVEYVLNSKENETSMFIRLYRDQDNGEYDISLRLYHQDDAGSKTDAGDTEADAMDLAGSGEYFGFMKGLDTTDFYDLELTDRESIYVNVTPDPTMSVALTLFIDGTKISEDKARHPDIEVGTTRKAEYVMPRTHLTSRAVLKVLLDHAHGNYTIEVTVLSKPADTEPPVVVHLEPTPGILLKNEKEWELKGTATDYNEVTSIELSFDQTTWVETNLVGEMGVYTWNATLKFTHRGNNTIYIRATDDQGNQGVTESHLRWKPREKEPGFEAVALIAAIVVAVAFLGRRKADR